jgi:CheY-like chemotaxis protein
MEAQKEAGVVLYAEDDENDAEFMRMAFRKAGLGDRLHVVRDGKQAVDYLSGTGPFADRQQHPLPALLVLDVNLPVLSGFGVLRWVRNHHDFHSLPVMILTSSKEPAEKMEAISLGAIDFITKPDSGAKFAQVLGRFWR